MIWLPRHKVISLISIMAQLIVRNLDERIVRKLRERAAANGRSAEQEHREILREALLGRAAKRTFKDALRAMPDVGRDSDFERVRDKPRKVRL